MTSGPRGRRRRWRLAVSSIDACVVWDLGDLEKAGLCCVGQGSHGCVHAVVEVCIVALL